MKTRMQYPIEAQTLSDMLLFNTSGTSVTSSALEMDGEFATGSDEAFGTGTVSASELDKSFVTGSCEDKLQAKGSEPGLLSLAATWSNAAKCRRMHDHLGKT